MRMLRIASWLLPLSLLATNDAAAAGDERLVNAVKDRDRPAVEKLLKQSVDVNASHADGATALHWAAHWDDVETVGMLLRAGARVDAANEYGVTPLVLACENRNHVIAEKLLAAGANAKATRMSGETVLMTAARTGSVEIVKALLSRGADVNVSEPAHRQTALMWAISNGHADVVAALLEAGADLRARSATRERRIHDGNRAAFSRNDHDQIVQLGGFTPLLFAARQGEIAIAKLLLARGADINETAPIGYTPLVLAAHSGHGALAAFLLESGANPNADGAGYTALHAAVLRGDVALLKVLLARGANPDARITRGSPSRYVSAEFAFHHAWVGATPFWLAARFAEPEIARILKAAGADPNIPTIETVTTRGERGAAPEAQRLPAPVGLVTPAMAAIWTMPGYFTADRRERNLTPTQVAARVAGDDERTSLETLKTIVELGGSVTASDSTGATALHGAASNGFAAVAEFLVQKGADVNAKNSKGLTPLSLAVVPIPAAIANTQGLPDRTPVADLLRKLGGVEAKPEAKPSSETARNP